MRFGDRLRELRKERGITQRTLAAKVHVDHTYVSKIERGAIPPPSAVTIYNMTQALGVDESELMILAQKTQVQAHAKELAALKAENLQLYLLINAYRELVLLNPLNVLPESASEQAHKWYSKARALELRVLEIRKAVEHETVQTL